MPDYDQGLGGEAFADGIYNFHCVDAGEKESTQTHNPMIELQLDCLNDDFTRRVRVVDRLVFTPNSYWKIDSFRRATGEKISQQSRVSFEAANCIDRKGRLALKTTMYNGKARNEVDYYVEPDQGQVASEAVPAAVPPVGQPAPKGSVPKPEQPF